MVVRAKRLLRSFCGLVVAVIVALPLVFGPAACAAVRLLGGEPEHTCACGMARPGECGCPECMRIEKQKEEGSKAPVVRSHCEEDDVALGPALPLGDCAPLLSFVKAPRGARVHSPIPRSLHTQIEPAPPTPPPRA